jgi:hypothetical protein
VRELLCSLVSAAGLLAAPAPLAKDAPVTWRYTLAEPPAGWIKADFDDSA